MAQPYVGEIRMFGGNFPPVGWMFCDGQLLPISENETLFQLIGTTYGGDGQSTFALPNLQSRIPIHQGTGKDGSTYVLAEAAGTETVTITSSSTPIHNHPPVANTSPATAASPQGNVISAPTAPPTVVDPLMFGTGTGMALHPTTITMVGGNAPHENCQPFLCVDFIISLFGIFPTPN